MSSIKRRRLEELRLASHPELHVGDCVPFYFCPRSIMLYLIYCRNHLELEYRGGQEPIVHLEADLRQTVEWVEEEGLRWAFTLSNAGSYHFEDRCNLAQLGELDWTAIQATDWRLCKEGKQAEFLVENRFPWHLVQRIGVHSRAIHGDVVRTVHAAGKQCRVDVITEWYY